MMMHRFEGDFLSHLSTEQLEEILRADRLDPPLPHESAAGRRHLGPIAAAIAAAVSLFSHDE